MPLRVTKSLFAIRMISRLPFAASVRNDDFESLPPKNSRAASASGIGSSSPISIMGTSWLILHSLSRSAVQFASSYCFHVMDTDWRCCRCGSGQTHQPKREISLNIFQRIVLISLTAFQGLALRRLSADFDVIRNLAKQ